MNRCHNCGGTGLHPAPRLVPTPCPACNGQGEIEPITIGQLAEELRSLWPAIPEPLWLRIVAQLCADERAKGGG